LRANTQRKRRNTSWKRFCASCGGKSATGGCFPITSSSSGNEVDDELTIRVQRLAEGFPPLAQLGLALAQKRADKALEGWARVAYGISRLYWVELAGREQATRRDKHLVQLVHDGRLADPGIAGDEHEFREVLSHNSVEDLDQAVNLALPRP